ncbi:cytochrome P450 [Novosphingobium sp. 9U]|uniref:cytochrome P450 n=1 Tax=Novosphingobium sp. 9U TaxID=2653158 RepID=UPI0012F00333|nr:cytochrome P450 [Novosphingobium sp. 9U]VWX50126.1 putative cytochrome P450 127A1 [Novosphingobium sp. 9U]
MTLDPGLRDFHGRPVAAHVPPELIRRIDYFNDPLMARDPFAFIRRVGEEPPLVYNLCNPLKGQSWLPTRAEIIRMVLSRPKLFSARNQTEFSQLIGETWRFGPIEMDPPDHGKFRALMNPWFSQPAVEALGDRIRTVALDLIEPLAAKSGCDFVQEFAIPFPISVFLEIFGLAGHPRETFLEWVRQLLHSSDLAENAAGAQSIATFLRALLKERAANPRHDIASRIATAEIDGAPVSDDDKLGMAFVLFTGGLDTVTASLGFHFQYLATHPEVQAELRAHPGKIPEAIEELLRRHSPVHISRQAQEDVTIEGVTIRKGDWVTILTGLASLDGSVFAAPETVRFDRQGRHTAFGFGTHFCMGANLARYELQLAMRELLARIPPFELAEPQEPPHTRGGFVFGVETLELKW